MYKTQVFDRHTQDSRLCGILKAPRANRQCIVRTGNPVSRHHIVHLKGQGNRHFWPDKVAVLYAWSRKGRSPGCCLSTGANDRLDYSNGREFTVISPEFLRPAGWDCLRRAWQAGIPGALRRSLQILVVVMEASPGFFRRRRSLFILWRGLLILWRGFFILKGLTAQDHRRSVLVHLSHLKLFHGVGRGGHRHDDTRAIVGVMDVNVMQMVHEFHQHGRHLGAPLVSSLPEYSWRQ